MVDLAVARAAYVVVSVDVVDLVVAGAAVSLVGVPVVVMVVNLFVVSVVWVAKLRRRSWFVQPRQPLNSSSRLFAFENPLTGVLPVVVNIYRLSAKRGMLCRSSIAAVERWTTCWRPFFALLDGAFFLSAQIRPSCRVL